MTLGCVSPGRGNYYLKKFFSQNVVDRPLASESLVKMQIPNPTSDLINQSLKGWDQEIYIFNKLSSVVIQH